MAMPRACPFGGSVSRVVAVERGTSEGFLAHGVILIVMRGTPKSWAQVGSRGKVPPSNPVSPPPERACSEWFPIGHLRAHCGSIRIRQRSARPGPPDMRLGINERGNRLDPNRGARANTTNTT